MNCPYCGKEVPSESNFCPNCGASIAPRVSERDSVKFEIKYRPSYALLEVQLPENGHIIAEAGAMTYMSNNIGVETRTRMKDSGIVGAIKVSLLGGETLFISALTVKNHIYHIYQKIGVENKIQLLNHINSPK